MKRRCWSSSSCGSFRLADCILPGTRLAPLLSKPLALEERKREIRRKWKKSMIVQLTTSSGHCHLRGHLIHREGIRMALLADPSGHGGG